MAVFCFILMLMGFVPLTRAWWLADRTTLRPTLGWVLAVWLAWSLVSWDEVCKHPAERPWLLRVVPTHALRYLAASLTACAGIAVLGARRPGLEGWNFVLVCLLLVLWLPMAE